MAMRGWILLGTTLVASVALAGRPAPAAPIRYQATFFLSMNGVPTLSTVDLPDLDEGGAVSLPAGYQYQGGGEPIFPAPTRPLDGDFLFEIVVKDAAAAGFDGAPLTVRGT